MAKPGFNGQWIEVAKVGKFRDSKGVLRDLTPELLQSIVANFNAGGQEAPLTIGHPKHAAPAYGWITELRMNGDVLEMKAEDTADEFEGMIRDGRFRTRSAGILLKHPSMSAPTIDHVAFLGAEPPAVKGLRKIQFSESAEGESFDLEEPINLQEKNMLEDKDVEKVTEGVFEKIKNFFKPAETGEASEAAAFSESQAKQLITEAVEAAKAEFREQLEAKDAAIAELSERVDGQASGTRRAEIASFVESIPAEKGRHFLKRMGVVEFMESLADADAGDKDEAIRLSEGDTEHKFSRLDWFKNYVNAQKSFVQFGEQFGDLKATAEAQLEMVNAEDVNELRKGMGVKKAADGGEK